AEVERLLLDLPVAAEVPVGPLSREECLDLVAATFAAEPDVVRDFVGWLFERTRGNPFFMAEVLGSLVQSGRLRREGDRWMGWDVSYAEVPASIREGVEARLRALGERAGEVAAVAAVMSRGVTHARLRAVSGLNELELVEAVEELEVAGILREAEQGGGIAYEFTHPLVQESIYAGLGLARTRLLHRRVAEVLEAEGSAEDERLEELAYHFSRGDDGQVAPRVVHYLCAAGRQAAARRADREAARFLRAAADRLEAMPDRSAVGEVCAGLEETLARVYQRLGRYPLAARYWTRALADAEGGGDAPRQARIHLRLAQAAYWEGRYDAALEACARGIEVAEGAGQDALEAHLHTLRGICLQALGRDEAEAEMLAALELAERIADPRALARAHRALMILHTWTGHADRVREHGARAIELARRGGDRNVEFWATWALAVMEGLLGDIPTMERHVAVCERLADELRSPVLRLWTQEVVIEHAAASGDWDRGIALGERAVADARDHGQTALLPRLLVWVALIYLGRGDTERGEAYVDEAWELSGAAGEGPYDIHRVVPAHIGRAALLVHQRRFREAIDVGERGLAIAEHSGYVIWALHRLLPHIAEAYFWLNDVDGARAIGERMRRYSEGLGHRLGNAWTLGFQALEVWHRGDPKGGAVLLRQAAEALEAVPMIPDAVRLRRQLAGRLADIGDREGALAELRHVHRIFVRMGAEGELKKTRDQFRELGARPPSLGGSEGLPLTDRELEIARLVAAHKSNKAIARELGISPRTVGTHLSNIFQKLDLHSRDELADYLRESGAQALLDLPIPPTAD
ncbi:MAG: helix-turn-helix transcriptional regulator, partial [Gemmatimonadetes bacterium]